MLKRDAPARDARWLGRLQDYYQTTGVMPTLREMATVFHASVGSSLTGFITRQVTAGYLERVPGTKRLRPGQRFFERVMATSNVSSETIRDGQPSAYQLLSIDKMLVKAPTKTVLLTVKDDAMSRTGIRIGDTVVVQRAIPVEVGDIVVAAVANVFVIRRLAKDSGGVFLLEADNRDFPSIQPPEGLEVFGRVMGLYRTY